MSCIHHHFILGLVGSYQDDRNLYFLLPQIQGGELFSVIHKEGKHGISDEAAIFYGACIVEALGYLHARNIVYRDMKPENALIDHKGYCILIDLGFAKIVVDKTYTLCGTPEYIAPEIILSKGHNKAVDYWSFGVLIYEMMVGRSPFSVNGTNQVALLKSIVRGAYSCPDTMNVASKDLITRLLITRQTRRLGNLSRGCLDVREHIWFKSLNFNQLNSREADAPWVPLAQDLQDLSQFGECSQEDESSYTLPPLRSGEQNYFAEF
jgi:protein kinase A